MRLPPEGTLIPILVQPADIPEKNPRGGGYRSGGEVTVHKVGGRPIRDVVRTPAGVAKGSDMGEGPRYMTVGETG